MFHSRTKDAARGKWRGILLEFGLPESCLKNKHGPCPICQSKDGFRWDDKDGTGSYICTCGSGSGMDLAISVTGRDYRTVCDEIDLIVNNIKADTVAPKRELTADERRTALVGVWNNTAPMQAGDLAHKYLESRGVGELIYPAALRFGRAIADGEGGVRPCMVALVGVHGEGKFRSMHRTFLRPDGLAKADMEAPRKLMPGDLPAGACVMLSEYTTGPLGIAEGIETALSASALYSLPVWSALNSALLQKWQPPEGCDEVAIFGDNDRKFGGQAAAYTLAHRLAIKGIHVTVHIPPMPGEDWNDVLVSKYRKGAA